MLEAEFRARGIRKRFCLGLVASRNAQTGQNSPSSGSSVPHAGQARLAGVVATVCSSPPGSYSILAIVAYEKNRLINAVCLRDEFKAPIRTLCEETDL